MSKTKYCKKCEKVIWLEGATYCKDCLLDLFLEKYSKREKVKSDLNENVVPLELVVGVREELCYVSYIEVKKGGSVSYCRRHFCNRIPLCIHPGYYWDKISKKKNILPCADPSHLSVSRNRRTQNCDTILDNICHVHANQSYQY